MTEPASDPLEAWRAGFDATGAGSIEQLTQLAHLSRFIADYGDRSADAHLVLFALTRNPAYLARAVQVGTPSASGELFERAASLIPGALDRAPVPGRWRSELMRARATICYSQATQSDQLSDYAAARAALDELVQALPRDDPQLMPTAASLANVIREIVRRGGDATIGDALSYFERALAVGRPGEEHYDAVLLDTARTAAETGRTDRAFELYGQASNREIACQDVRTIALQSWQSWLADKRTDDLATSVAGWRVAATLSGEGVDDLNNLVGTLHELRQITGEGLDEQIAVADRLVSARGTKQDLVNAALFHVERFTAKHTREDVDTAANLFVSADEILDAGRLLRRRYLGTGDREDFAASVAFWHQRIAESPDDVEWRGGLAGALVERFDRFRDLADLQDALDAIGEPGDRRRLELTIAVVQTRYHALGRAPDLDLLIELSGRLLASCPSDDPKRPKLASDNAYFLIRRYETDADRGALDSAIQALEADPDPNDPRWLGRLGSALIQRYDWWGMRNLDDVARARPLFQDAIALTSEAGPWRASLLIGLSATLQRLFSYTPVFLEDAELPRTLLEQAVVEAADDSEMSERANFLLACLIIRSRDRPDRRSLNRAVAMLTSIAEAGSALSANARVELAASLRIRDRPVDRVRVSAAYRVALPTLMDTNVVLAQTTAVEWGLWASRLRMWDEAAEAFRHALSAADAIYVANTAGSSDVLGRATGLAADAAFALAKAGQVAEAALVLETSRFRAGSEALALLQTDLDALAGSGGSELVARLERARAHWAHAVQVADTPSPAPSHVSMSFASAPMHDIVAGRTPISDEEPPTSPADRRAWLRRSHTARETRAELDAAISAVRQADGMSTFLADPQYADIVAVADRVPVLYLSAADHGGLAILVESGKAARVEFLPALTTAAVDGRVSAMRDDLDATARWLWTAAMARVLRMTPAGSLVLVPCGKLGLLPLHAAWTPDRRRRSGRRNVSDTLVIAYAPNARSVPAASHQRADTFLAVEDPAPLPAPLNPVSFAHEEVAAAAAWFPKAQVLANTAATPERVVPAICSSSVYHFACHGVVDIRNPRRSALILAGGAPLTVGQLLELQLERRPANGRLAVLFACDTAVAGSAVPDEVISLPAALLQAGLTGVVGTQWPVRGLPSALLSARFYLHVRQDGRDWATSLTLAQRWLRESTNAELAAFVHPRAGLSVIPVAARRAMWRDLAARDPTARGFADVADWGAYVYMGDPGPMLARTDQGAR